MTNRGKIKKLKQKLSELDSITSKHEDSIVSNKDYSKYLKDQIEFLKEIQINNIKQDIENDINDLEVLKKVKNKMISNERLNKMEIVLLSSIS